MAVATPGKTGTPSSWQRRTTAGPKPGRDDEPRPGLDRPVDLLGGEHRARADEQVGVGRPWRAMASARGGGAEGHLDAAQPARAHGGAERLGVPRVLQDHDGQDPGGGENVDNVFSILNAGHECDPIDAVKGVNS